MGDRIGTAVAVDVVIDVAGLDVDVVVVVVVVVVDAVDGVGVKFLNKSFTFWLQQVPHLNCKSC